MQFLGIAFAGYVICEWKDKMLRPGLLPQQALGWFKILRGLP